MVEYFSVNIGKFWTYSNFQDFHSSGSGCPQILHMCCDKNKHVLLQQGIETLGTAQT